jgi:hypothetical protein
VLTGFARLPEAVPVDVRVCGAGEQSGLPRTGEADVGFVRGADQTVALRTGG